MGNYGVMSFKEFLAVQEGLLLPDRPPVKGLSRINPFPTSQAHRQRWHAKPVKPSKPFAPTIRRVAEVVPQKLIPKLKPR